LSESGFSVYDYPSSKFKHRIQQQIDIHDMQFGFMKGKETTVTFFVIRQMQEKFRAKGYVYFEKSF